MNVTNLKFGLANLGKSDSGEIKTTLGVSSASVAVFDSGKTQDSGSNVTVTDSVSLSDLSASSNILSNASYTHKAESVTFYETNLEEPSQYTAATIASLRMSRQMNAEKSQNLMDKMDEFGGITVSGTTDPNPNAQSEAEIRAKLVHEGGRTIIQDAADQAQKEREAKEKQDNSDAATVGGAGETSTGTGTDGTGSAEHSAAAAQAAATPEVAVPASPASGDTAGTTPSAAEVAVAAQVAASQEQAAQAVQNGPKVAGDGSGIGVSVDMLV